MRWKIKCLKCSSYNTVRRGKYQRDNIVQQKYYCYDCKKWGKTIVTPQEYRSFLNKKNKQISQCIRCNSTNIKLYGEVLTQTSPYSQEKTQRYKCNSCRRQFTKFSKLAKT